MTDMLRNSVNLVALAVLTAVLLIYAGAQWAQDVIFDDRYPISVALPETGGLVEHQEVVLLGTHVGNIHRIELTIDGVMLHLLIEPDRAIPRHAFVEVIRRSAIGEQTLNLIPVEPDAQPDEALVRFIDVAQGWEALEPGDEVDVRGAHAPVDIRTVIENVEELFRGIDPDHLHTAIFEAGTAVSGRGEVLVDINRHAHDLNEVLVAGIPDFERLIDTSGPVLTALSEAREEIAESITHLANLSELLAGNRPVLEELTTEAGTRVLTEADTLIRAVRPNVTCLIEDFRDFNIATDANRHWLAQLMDFNQSFFGAVDVVFQWDPYRPKKNWARVADLLIAGDAEGEVYEQRTPTPATRPGAACVTPFGVGVNAVRQPDHQPPEPTSPGIEWAPLVEGGTSEGEIPDGPPPLATPRPPLPVTGGGLAGTLLGPALAAYALLLRRRHR